MTIDPAIATALRWGLGFADVTDTPPPLRETALEEAISQRVQCLVWKAGDAGAISVPPELAQRLRDVAHAALRTCLLAEETAVLAHRALESRGIEHRVLKGVAIAHLDHVDPAERVFGDADLLVRRADHTRALAALTDAGFARVRPPVRTWWERRFGKAVVMTAPNGGELDLHLAITDGHYGQLLDLTELFARPPTSVHVGGHALPALDAPDRLAQAGLHAVLGEFSEWRALRDVAQLLAADGVWERAVERWPDVADVLAEAFERAAALFGIESHPAVEWSTAHRRAADSVGLLEQHRRSSEMGWAPQGLGVLRALGPGDRALFVLGLALPSRANLRARGRSRTGQLLGGVRSWGAARRSSTSRGRRLT